MAVDVHLRETDVQQKKVDDLIAASSLGADGMAELCARTPNDRLAAIRHKAAVHDDVDDVAAALNRTSLLAHPPAREALQDLARALNSAAQADAEAREQPERVLANAKKKVKQVAATTCDRPVTTSSVADLLARVRAGDPAAWEEIVRRYDRLVWAKVRSFRMQDADAFDAVQMTWLRLAENCHRLRSPERLAEWLATTASRECLGILRQAKRVAYPADALADDLPDPSVGPEQRVIDADAAQLLQNLLAELPPRGQTLLRALFADSPQPYAEVARITGIPIGSMGPTRARALQQLRQMIDERGLGESRGFPAG